MKSELPPLSGFHIHFFTWYTKWLLKRRFSHVYISNEFVSKDSRSCIFYGNHCYWWDALIPLVLNKSFFGHMLRAVMEKKQIDKWPFFKKIGALPIEIGSLKSLRKLIMQVISHLSKKNRSLWIYPEGKIVPIINSPSDFQPLLAMLVEKLPDVQICCVSQYIDYSSSDKAELYISLTEIEADSTKSRSELTSILHQFLKERLCQLIDNQLNKDLFIKLF